MTWKALIELDAWPARACIKVDDAPVGIEEGRLAGCWTVGLSASGNGVGLEPETLPPWRRKSGARIAQAELLRRPAPTSSSRTSPADAGRARDRRPDRRVMTAARPRRLAIMDRCGLAVARARAVFALYGGLMAFGAYFAMYAFRKPFTVASFADAAPLARCSTRSPW